MGSLTLSYHYIRDLCYVSNTNVTFGNVVARKVNAQPVVRISKMKLQKLF